MSRSTITAIARRVGVSAATVSRALNGAPGVSEKKRREIQAIAAELNYHPNAIARNLQGQRTNTIAYAVDVSDRPSTDLFFFKDFITNLAFHCADYNVDLLIHPVTAGEQGVGQIERVLQSGRADGVIITDIRHDDQRIRYLHEHKLHFVAFGHDNGIYRYPYVDVNGEQGIYRVTQHLIERGHHRIAFLGLPLAYYCAIDRRDGYFQALRDNNIPKNPEYIIVGLTNETEARIAMEQLLMLPQPPTAFVTASDMLAIHAMSVAHSHGLRAGQDYAITGFDDLPMSQHTDPPLTSVRQPFDQICKHLIELAMRQNHAPIEAQQILLEPELIIRDSS
ncbi:MAG: LacI family transcriptional regulator [Chloroflexi bacterium AL-W]|nr:LacI family transcriptional regulator [Chloroflexi bacterium AL-N1]NOK67855.1 LacI family transcriptional regulator [Chloroflexi bacterium AL-N10]NOK75376.1 LacI family transcriptional regulator [Chloroflexi bacterium AL-N5]NOK82164.1 LacI family transcriptional regulator [Chloroflexi bacterium AL-W]NOK90009.1 LacI family transcriptional regulator [Chloroflexi bacterium AL-N15]